MEKKTMKVKSNQTRWPLSLSIISRSYRFEIDWNPHRNFKLLLTLCECTSLYLRGPHLTRNVAKFPELHPSPGSSTGLMCLKLPRCRARSQPAHDSCGCWRENNNNNNTNPTTEAAIALAPINIAEGVHELKSCMKHSRSILRFWFPSCT